MNYLPLTRGTNPNLSDIPYNDKRTNNNSNLESNSKVYKTAERNRVSLTPDRQIHQSNSSREIHGYSSIQKYNPRLLDNRNSSAKKSDFSNLHDNGNPKEKQSQKDFSQLSIINNQADYSTISKLSNKSTSQAYLDRRHLESQQKINRLRHEKLTHESTELRFKPVISQNSKKILKNIISKEQAIKVICGNIDSVNKNTNNTYTNSNNYESNYAAPQKCNNVYFKNKNNNYVHSQDYISGFSNQKNPVKPQYSQLDDYRKIAETRQNLVQNPQRNNTIDVKKIYSLIILLVYCFYFNL